MGTEPVISVTATGRNHQSTARMWSRQTILGVDFRRPAIAGQQEAIKRSSTLREVSVPNSTNFR